MSFDGKEWIWKKWAREKQSKYPVHQVQTDQIIVPTYEYPPGMDDGFLTKIFKFFFWKHQNLTIFFILGFVLGAWLL